MCGGDAFVWRTNRLGMSRCTNCCELKNRATRRAANVEAVNAVREAIPPPNAYNLANLPDAPMPSHTPRDIFVVRQ